MFDAIVIGARCGGSPTAALLARRGYHVLLVDKATFPSDTMSGANIHQPGVARLRRWGLLDRLVATGVPPITRFRFDVGPFALTGTQPAADGVAEAYVPRRTILDKLLADWAVEAGAELREGFSVQELLFSGDRVTGIRARTRRGTSVTERAQIVIGADGHRSLVARSVQAPAYDVRPALTCTYYSFWSGVPVEGSEIYPRDGRAIVATPTHDGLTFVAVIWPRAEFHAVRADIEGSFLRSLDLAPDLAERVRAGKREERWIGTADLPNFFRQPHGPGWALVGDAGYHKDPVTAQGMTDAFRDADLLAEAIDAGFGGRLALDAALAGYEARRNAAVRPMYDLTHQLAQLAPPPPDMQQVLAALRHDPAQAARFWGTVSGAVPIADFYAPDNLAQILGPAAA